MRYSKIIFFLIIMLMMLPIAVYAAVDHSGHDMSTENPSLENQSNNISTESPSVNNSGDGSNNQIQNQHNESLRGTDSQHGIETENMSSQGEGHGSSGHDGGETKKNVLEPMKNGIVAGLLGLNGIIVVVAWIMKKKIQWGV